MNDEKYNGIYVKSENFSNGRYYWYNESNGYTIQWVRSPGTGDSVWTISKKMARLGELTSYDDAWSPSEIQNWMNSGISKVVKLSFVFSKFDRNRLIVTANFQTFRIYDVRE